MHCRDPRLQAGFTFAELAFGLLILVIGAAVLINHLAVNYYTTNMERDRVFAFSKAQAILAEVQNRVDRGEIETVDLDLLDDGAASKSALTIQTDASGSLLAPDHVLSGNKQRNGQWVWSRRISVQPFAGADSRNVRYVTVRVFKRDSQGNERAQADLSAVVNSSGDASPSAQVYDLYLIAIENIPGWWVYMESLKPFFESVVMDLQSRNPGMTFRTHWITKASFGRNRTYRPYTNVTADSNAVIPEVYTYPGRMPAGSASGFHYVPDNIKARLNVEGTERNGLTAGNPHPYALADFFNHAMRYEDELELWNARVAAVAAREAAIAAAVASGSTPPAELDDMSKEPTLRLFLESLCSDPERYRNALVINLHGKLLPMPALRNFSDPAKSQVAHPDLRVVTHPEELRTRRDDGGVTDALRFRMYAFAYQTALSPYTGPEVMQDPMVVEVVGVNLTQSSGWSRLKASCTLQNLPGGVVVGGSSDYAATWQPAKYVNDGPAANEMYYRARYESPTATSPGFTRIYLYNTPTRCLPDLNGRGLPASERARLYQMEYVPSPVDVDASGQPTFETRHLGTVDTVRPKNTARWTLSLDPAILGDGSFDGGNPTGDVVLQVRTRIATGLSTGGSDWENSGSVWPLQDPDNLSVTYAWWADSKEDVPFTERAQFQGDPRHLPYKDCFRNGNDFPNAYNWYLDNLTDGTELAMNDFPSIDATLLRDRWGGTMAIDSPRFFQLLREGLVRSGCVYSAVTGWSNYYLAIGGEVGADTTLGYPNSIPTNWDPYGVPNGIGYMNTVTGARRLVRSWEATGYWWGMPWLGELVPDNQVASQWLDSASGAPRGNLAAGTTMNRFYQQAANTVYVNSARSAYGTQFFNSNQRSNLYGCTTFFNIGTNTSTFQQTSSTSTGTRTGIGSELNDNYNLAVSLTLPVSRPWTLTASTSVAEHWNYAPYAGVGNRFTGSLFRSYYTVGSSVGSGVVKLANPANTTAAYVVVNGLNNATVSGGATFNAQFNLLTMVHTLLEAGSTTNTLRIPQLPRLEIESPTDITELVDPSTIEVVWGTGWSRWDELPYTETGTYAEDESLLQYVVHYSTDGGVTWRYAQDGTLSTPGTRPASPAYVLPDSGGGNETFDWDVSSGFPEGIYRLRVDCFRDGEAMHFAYHQTSLYIQR